MSSVEPLVTPHPIRFPSGTDWRFAMASATNPVWPALPSELSDALGDGLVLVHGGPAVRLVVVDLDRLTPDLAPPSFRATGAIVIGASRRPLPLYAEPWGRAFAMTLVPERHEHTDATWQVGVRDVEAAVASLALAVTRSPTAAQSLIALLEAVGVGSVDQGLVTESLTYSMLMAGDEHARWLAHRTRRNIPQAVEPVKLQRDGDLLTVALNRPERHNAFAREIRDGLVEAFELVAADDSIARVRLIGHGASFCSGGDLDEFGLTADVSLAHLIRVDRSVAARIHAVRNRVEVELHGACIGAGIELATFAGRVVARPDARIQLPEVAMGLVPGAGGTVGITRRIGPWRTAWLAISGEALPLATALRWGLVDELVD